MKLMDNPSACVDERRRAGRACGECYFSQVDGKNQWTGSGRCWNASCLVYDGESGRSGDVREQ